MKKLPSTIAVDGPAGSGKSSVSFAIARRLDYLFVDTGAFYRAITFLALEQGIPIASENEAAVSRLAEQTQFEITPYAGDGSREYTILAHGRDITDYIHGADVDANVSIVAAMSGVRAALLDVQRDIAAKHHVIMAGRDIGTVVLPDADLKIFIDANLSARAVRRYQQRITNGESATLEEIRQGLNTRDDLDSNRKIAPMARAADAVYLDTSGLDFEEAVDAFYQIVCAWSEEHAGED